MLIGKSFSGDNLLGNFVPAFSSKSIFFADVNGNIKSIDSSSGNIQWEQEVGEHYRLVLQQVLE